MERRIALLAMAAIIGFFLGCSEKIDLSSADASAISTISKYDNFVSMNQVLNYIGKDIPVTKSSQSEYRLDMYCSASGDTLMYIINYGNCDGWQILSSDTRTPAVIAESDTGFFSLEEGSEGFRIWIACTAADIAYIRNCRDEELNFTAEEISVHKSFWDSRQGTDSLPSRIDPNLPPPTFGHWEVSEYTTTIIEDKFDHLTPHWVQDAPYNSYCPYKSDGSGDRAPAGCVAVAGAQVLYFLHDSVGVPSTMVSNGYCTGYVGGEPNQHFYNPTTSIWSSMNPEYSIGSCDAESLMIGYVGQQSNMNYGNAYSGTTILALQSAFEAGFGIHSRDTVYIADTVRSYLSQHMPIIIGAEDLFSGGGYRHCFVIDGYKRYYTKTTYYHYWVMGDIDPEIPGVHEPYYTYYYSPSEEAIKINWGWASQWDTHAVNDGWYELTSTWIVQNGGSLNYQAIEMLYGFN